MIVVCDNISIFVIFGMEILSDKEKEDLLIKIKNERIVMKREKKEQFGIDWFILR